MLMTMLASSDPSLVDDVADSASETAESVLILLWTSCNPSGICSRF